MSDIVRVHSSHGTYFCKASTGDLIRTAIDRGGEHHRKPRVRFEWPSSIRGDVDVLACTEYLADGSVIPPDPEFLQENY